MEIVNPENVGLSSVFLKRITTAMNKYIDHGQFAGVVVLVARRGKVAYLEKFGWQDLEAKRPMSLDTIFRIYSMTKPITSAAIMMLYEEGKIRLSDPVSNYIPSFKNFRVMQNSNDLKSELISPNREPTVHDLLTHTAGLAYGLDDSSVLDRLYNREIFSQFSNPEFSLKDLVRLISELPLAHHPGTAFRYSFSIDILGYIIELISQRPLDDFLKERIFKPLGMADTDFWVPPSKADRLAVVYGPPKEAALSVVESARDSRYLHPAPWFSGGGGLVSTISDYFRFVMMLQNRGSLDGVRLLGRKTVELMLQNHLPEGIYSDPNRSNGFGIGGAVLLNPGLNPRPGSAGRFGWGGMLNTEWWYDPQEELQCILMTQYMPGFTLPIVEDFAQTVYQALV